MCVRDRSIFTAKKCYVLCTGPTFGQLDKARKISLQTGNFAVEFTGKDF